MSFESTWYTNVKLGTINHCPGVSDVKGRRRRNDVVVKNTFLNLHFLMEEYDFLLKQKQYSNLLLAKILLL